MDTGLCFECDAPVNVPAEATNYTCAKCGYHEDWSNDNNQKIVLPEFNRIMNMFN